MLGPVLPTGAVTRQRLEGSRLVSNRLDTLTDASESTVFVLDAGGGSFPEAPKQDSKDRKGRGRKDTRNTAFKMLR